MRLGHAGDLLRHQEAAALADVELDDLGRLFLQYLGELEHVDQPLAGRDGDVRVRRHARQFVDVLGRHGLLEEERIELLQDVGDP